MLVPGAVTDVRARGKMEVCKRGIVNLSRHPESFLWIPHQQRKIREKGGGFGVRYGWVECSLSCIHNYVVLSKSLDVLELQGPYLQNENTKTFAGLLCNLVKVYFDPSTQAWHREGA